MTYILAEIGSAHMGDPDLCIELIHKAKEAGADGVKVQVWSWSDPGFLDRYDELKGKAIQFTDWREIIESHRGYLWLQYYGDDSYDFVSLYNENVLIDGREKKFKVSGDYPRYIYGQQKYPTPINEADIDSLREGDGYADHTAAEDLRFRYVIPAMAIAAGATLIEKHICLNREELKKKSKDWISALEPHEFKEFVHFIREAETAL